MFSNKNISSRTSSSTRLCFHNLKMQTKCEQTINYVPVTHWRRFHCQTNAFFSLCFLCLLLSHSSVVVAVKQSGFIFLTNVWDQRNHDMLEWFLGSAQPHHRAKLLISGRHLIWTWWHRWNSQVFWHHGTIQSLLARDPWLWARQKKNVPWIQPVACAARCHWMGII